MKKTCVFCVPFALILLAGCSSVPTEPLGRTEQPVSSSTPASGKAYLHTAANSRFRLGTSVVQRSELGFSKLVGDEGVFAIVVASGWAMGLPNSNAPSQSIGRNLSADDHNKAVLAYFEGAGLDPAQVEGVNAHANIHSGGLVGSPEADITVSPIAAGYTSCISRQIDGIPVVDSFAWAGFDDDDDVVEEGVYWPEIPDATVAGARALRDSLSDQVALSAFRAKVGDAGGRGRVVIRHAAGALGSTFEAVASFDVPDHGVSRHFDPSGTEFKMISERDVPSIPR